MTTIGNLRHEVTIESQSSASDGQGGSSVSWNPFMTGMAEIKPITGLIRMAADKVETDVSHKITMRYRKGIVIDSSMRVNYTVGTVTRLFYIHGILNVDERNRFWLLLCKEGVGR